MIRLSPFARISIGLVSLTTILLLVLDLFFGLLSNEEASARKLRQSVSENLMVQLSTLIRQDNREALTQTMRAMAGRDGDILSVGIRKEDGTLIAATTNHERTWVAPSDHRSTLTHVLVPVYSGKRLWGKGEISFRALPPKTLEDWLQGPAVRLVLPMTIVGFLVFYLYMRRVLQHLDPTAVIPERVRMAFDTLAEGVVIIDHKGQIMLANNGFRALHLDAKNNLNGRKVADLSWLKDGLGDDPTKYPWVRAMRDEAPTRGAAIEIRQPDGSIRKAVINCSPVMDAKQTVRGCMITFDDVTELDRANAQLRQTLRELELSRAQIATQNEELQKLATRDSLTGCLNRRAFFAGAEQLVNDARVKGLELSCIMTDIDHFKSYNDRFGHAVGDRVIKAVAKVLGTGLRAEDLLGRYGGEEFCLILPGVDMHGAMEIAERLREGVESFSGTSIRSDDGLQVTASFGVSTLKLGANNIAEVIDQADAALYAAKRAGRNRVTGWSDAANIDAVV
jgi:diguanylate cyclase (GGDEF)-like protein/PAS domain S-box-containing protein